MTIRYSFLGFAAMSEESQDNQYAACRFMSNMVFWGTLYFQWHFSTKLGRGSSGFKDLGILCWTTNIDIDFQGKRRKRKKKQLNKIKCHSERKSATVVPLKFFLVVCNYIDNKEIVINERWKLRLNIDQYSLVILPQCVIYVRTCRSMLGLMLQVSIDGNGTDCWHYGSKE